MRLCVPHSHTRTHIDTRTLIHVCISISLFFVVFFFFFHYSRCCIWYLLYSLAFPEPQCEQSSAGLLLIVSGIFNRVFITCVSSLALPRSDTPPPLPLSLCTSSGSLCDNLCYLMPCTHPFKCILRHFMAFISFALRISINSFWAFDILVQHSNNNNNNYNNFFLLSIPSVSHGKQWVIVDITTRSSIGN